MKKFIAIVLVTAFALAAHAAPPPQPITVAVLDFQTSGKELEKKGADAAIMLNAKLSTTDLYLVERQEIEKILGEQELGLSGLVTPETAAKVGKLTGAKVLITGRVFGADDKYFVVAKIMSTETSRVYGEMATFFSPTAMDGAINDLAPKIFSLILKRADTLIAKQEDPAERLERLKKLVADKQLPSVSIQVPEKHVNHAVIDPAVQTEFKHVLLKLGFDVLDANSDKQPAIIISGEGFSEMAGRRANLVSCRSRVEIKVIQTATGKLLLADRQTDVAIDIAEDIAGKAALQNAALKLLDRIIPAITAQ